jgi:TctA family transporter
MVWTLAIANIITVVLSLAVLNQLAKVTYIRGGVIIPFVLLLVFVGSYTANGQLSDLIVTFCFGVLGYLMVIWGWPRPPLVLGLADTSACNSFDGAHGVGDRLSLSARKACVGGRR